MLKFLKHLRSLELVDWLYLLIGRFSREKIVGQPKSIIFVCTGNICRSAYAEKKFALMLNDSSIKISSAGLETQDGKFADSMAIEVAKKRGVDLREHRTSFADEEKLRAADLILVMDSSHYRKIKPELRAKTRYLGSFAKADRISIKDPFGKSDEVFEQCFEQIDKALQGLKAELDQLFACNRLPLLKQIS